MNSNELTGYGPFDELVRDAIRNRIDVPAPRLLRLLALCVVTDGPTLDELSLRAAAKTCDAREAGGAIRWVRANRRSLLDALRAVARDVHADELWLAVHGSYRLALELSAASGRVSARQWLAEQVAVHFPDDAVGDAVAPLGGRTWMLGSSGADAAAIALVDGTGPVVAVACDARSGDCAWAIRDLGAYRHGMRLGVSERIPTGEPTAIAGNPRLRVWAVDPPIYASSVLDAGRRVWSGEWEGFIAYDVTPIERIVVDLLVREAGGHVTAGVRFAVSNGRYRA